MNLNSVDLNKLRVFHSVVKLGSYKLAGEDLGLTRSAISQSISILESQLGMKLFQRKGRKLFPTENAVELSKEFEKSQKILIKSINSLTGSDSKIEGVVRLGCYYEFAKNILSYKLKKFSSEYSGAQFRFMFDSPSRLQSYLENNRVDLTFSIYPHEGSSDILSKKIYQQELVLVTSDKFKLNKNTDYENIPIIDYYISHNLIQKWIYRHYKKKPRKLNIKYYAASAEMALKLIELEMGIGVVPKYIFDSYKSRKLNIFRPTTKELVDYIWLNYYNDQFSSSAHERLINFLI